MNQYNKLVQELKLLFSESSLNRKKIDKVLTKLSKHKIKFQDVMNNEINLTWLWYSYSTLHQFCQICQQLITTNEVKNKNGIKMALAQTSLILGDFEKANKLAIELKNQKQFNASFLNVSEIKPLIETEFIKISFDTRLKKDFAKFLSEDINNLVKKHYGAIFPVPHFILLNGKSFSPFIDGIRTAFLMVGHYQKNKHDKTIFEYAILHEIQHYITYQSQKMHFSTEPHLLKIQRNNFKFFDEGLAITKGYNCLNINNLYLVNDDIIAKILHSFSQLNFKIICDNWLDFIYDGKQNPIYEYAHSFVSFLINKYSFGKVQDFVIKLAKQNVIGLEQHFINCFELPLDEEINNWKNKLDKIKITQNDSFLKIAKVTENNDYVIFEYDSKYPIWHKQSIFVTSNGKLINTKTGNDFRYKKIGSFKISSNNLNKPLEIYCLFKNKIQIIKL